MGIVRTGLAVGVGVAGIGGGAALAASKSDVAEVVSPTAFGLGIGALIGLKAGSPVKYAAMGAGMGAMVSFMMSGPLLVGPKGNHHGPSGAGEPNLPTLRLRPCNQASEALGWERPGEVPGTCISSTP